MRGFANNANMSKGVTALIGEVARLSAAAAARFVTPEHVTGLGAEHHERLGSSAPPPDKRRGTWPPAPDATIGQLQKGAL